MTKINLKGGKIVRDAGGKVYRDNDCCCDEGLSCGGCPVIPDTLFVDFPFSSDWTALYQLNYVGLSGGFHTWRSASFIGCNGQTIYWEFRCFLSAIGGRFFTVVGFCNGLQMNWFSTSAQSVVCSPFQVSESIQTNSFCRTDEFDFTCIPGESASWVVTG